MRKIVARHDPTLGARVVGRGPLRYAEGPDPALDRPAHVRAGSSLAKIKDYTVVIQDDANFVALLSADGRQALALALPAGEGGRRQFDDGRGNKRFKLDLEACAVVPSDSDPSGALEEMLLAFGSGSTERRERVLILSDWAGWGAGGPRAALHDARELYATLRAAPDFAGSDMNIEGAVYFDGRVRLFGRGNGVARGGLRPLNASCDLDWPRLRAYLRDPRRVIPPPPEAVVQYELGALGGLPLGFTDAAIGTRLFIFSAAAEASPDAARDGPVAGSVIGVFDGEGGARWAVLRDHDGGDYRGKVEGVLLASEPELRLLAVVDEDDPAAPSELCEVDLTGDWHGAVA